jgi:hypothetical protein
VRYSGALDDIQKTLWNRMPENKRIHDRRQYMLIEFVLAPHDALVLIVQVPGGIGKKLATKLRLALAVKV